MKNSVVIYRLRITRLPGWVGDGPVSVVPGYLRVPICLVCLLLPLALGLSRKVFELLLLPLLWYRRLGFHAYRDMVLPAHETLPIITDGRVCDLRAFKIYRKAAVRPMGLMMIDNAVMLSYKVMRRVWLMSRWQGRKLQTSSSKVAARVTTLGVPGD